MVVDRLVYILIYLFAARKPWHCSFYIFVEDDYWSSSQQPLFYDATSTWSMNCIVVNYCVFLRKKMCTQNVDL